MRTLILDEQHGSPQKCGHLEDLEIEVEEKEGSVLLPNTVADPEAVMVKSGDTERAIFAVLRADRLINIAVFAEVLLERYLKLTSCEGAWLCRGLLFERELSHRSSHST